MTSWFGRTLFAMLGIVFLFKGGLSLILGFWRILFPLAMIAGGVYLVKNFFAEQAQIKDSKRRDAKRVVEKEDEVIQICPHCLQEIGSCPKCRR